MFPKCDVCGAPAAYSCTDLREIDPKDGCRAFEPVGEFRHGCLAHPPRPSRTYGIDEVIESA